MAAQGQGTTFVCLSRDVPNAITGLIANDRKIRGVGQPTIRETRYNRILGVALASVISGSRLSYFISPLAKRPLLGKTNATDSSVLHLQRWFDAFPMKLVKSAKP